jgi:TolB protein
MKRSLRRWVLSCLFMLAMPVRAELVIEITQGIDNPTVIAVSPFAWQGVGLPPEDVAYIVENDLYRSGQFTPVARENMLGTPSRDEDIFFRDWRMVNAQYLLIGSITPGAEFVADFALYDVLKQTLVIQGSERAPTSDARMLAHRIADRVYTALTGIPGAFATKLLYVAVTPVPGEKDYYELTLADSDGARPKVLLASREPILAPTWSPDTKEIAYVSFETSRPAIFRQNLTSGAREQLTAFRGLNGSPAWSPDGKRMAMVLSKDGSPDIYVLDLATYQLERITRHYAIDTEPTWMPDGKSLLFTSDRGGRPQIYRYDFVTGLTDRVTFEGSYNARARVAQDGRNVVLVHQQDGDYKIAVYDIETRRMTALTSTDLDESPSIAPNGSMVLYATKQAGRGILAAVSVDGGARFNLPARSGEVREPSWSPYLPKRP